MLKVWNIYIYIIFHALIYAKQCAFKTAKRSMRNDLYLLFSSVPIYDVAVRFCCTSLLLVYPYAGSPSVTSLTYNDQSKTLTCTSTGGPATSVTWRRDGVLITLNATHQQTKKLVDSVNGTYQTILTIDPSVGQSDIVGTYNCTVENDRGEASETVVVGETRTLATWHRHTSVFNPLLICTSQSTH